MKYVVCCTTKSTDASVKCLSCNYPRRCWEFVMHTNKCKNLLPYLYLMFISSCNIWCFSCERSSKDPEGREALDGWWYTGKNRTKKYQYHHITWKHITKRESLDIVSTNSISRLKILAAMWQVQGDATVQEMSKTTPKWKCTKKNLMVTSINKKN